MVTDILWVIYLIKKGNVGILLVAFDMRFGQPYEKNVEMDQL